LLLPLSCLPSAKEMQQDGTQAQGTEDSPQWSFEHQLTEATLQQTGALSRLAEWTLAGQCRPLTFGWAFTEVQHLSARSDLSPAAGSAWDDGGVS
jgi:hypothetical protein